MFWVDLVEFENFWVVDEHMNVLLREGREERA
jgi:hypothetical protein